MQILAQAGIFFSREGGRGETPTPALQKINCQDFSQKIAIKKQLLHAFSSKKTLTVKGP